MRYQTDGSSCTRSGGTRNLPETMLEAAAEWGSRSLSLAPGALSRSVPLPGDGGDERKGEETGARREAKQLCAKAGGEREL
jgi:hypothetical protein